MLHAIASLAQRIWSLLQAGWDWVRGLIRTLIDDIRDAVMPPMEAALAHIGSAPAAPAKPARQDTRPAVASSPALAPSAKAPAPAEAAPTAPDAAAERPSPTDKSDETALARMLASDDSPREVKFIRGWIAVQRQRTRKVSMFELLTRGLGYGPRDRKAQGKLNVYASTAKEPSDMDRAVAHSLLNGAVGPSAAIRMHKPGQLVERGKELTDAQILRKQADLKEGIYGRLQGTGWLLFSPDALSLTPRQGQSATEALDAVPSMPVMDSATAIKQSAA